jgi:ComF family protein
MTSALREIGLDVLSLFFPGKCFVCGGALPRGSCICAECLGAVRAIEGETCGRCGAPLAGGRSEHARDCPQCADLRLVFGRNVSFGVHRGVLRELVHLYKFGKRRSLHVLFAGLLTGSKGPFISGYDLIVPVPLARERALERGYNQSFLVARAIAARLHVSFVGEALVRRGNSVPQSGIRTRRERLANITDRIAVAARAAGAVRGKAVLLFDDVLTTGATASGCARALLGEGARSVDLLTIARTLVDSGEL